MRVVPRFGRPLCARVAASVLLPLAGCQVEAVENRAAQVLQRMVDQERCSLNETTREFPSGACNQPPPPGTREFRAAADSPATTGLAEDGQPIARIPVRVDRAFLARGKAKFEVYCATCHGLLGDGDSEVAENMSLRRPPALVERSVQKLPDGHLFRVISRGYGLMPSYGRSLTVDERWAVIAHLRVLALSQSMPLALLSPDARHEALRWLR